jgi:hypothetical protein
VLNYPPQAWELWTNANEANDTITRKPHFLNGSQMNNIKYLDPKRIGQKVRLHPSTINYILGNQHWFCESHITRKAVDEFMHNRFWAILLCDLCFGRE